MNPHEQIEASIQRRSNEIEAAETRMRVLAEQERRLTMIRQIRLQEARERLNGAMVGLGKCAQQLDALTESRRNVLDAYDALVQEEQAAEAAMADLARTAQRIRLTAGEEAVKREADVEMWETITGEKHPRPWANGAGV